MTLQDQLAYALLTGGGLLLAWPVASGTVKAGIAKFKSRTPSKTSHDSDRPAPAGVVEYLTTIAAASPMATPEIRMSYALDGKTEAEVLRAEVERLGRQV